MKKAIISFGVGYTFDDIKYFIHSCYLHAPDTDVFVFAGANIEALQTACRQYQRVTFVRYRQNLAGKLASKLLMQMPPVAMVYARLLSATYKRHRALAPVTNALATPLVQFMVKRFFILQQFLRTLPHEQVMLTDMRDVILQDDPFRYSAHDTLITGVEPINNAASDMNARWITQTYDRAMLDSVATMPVACAGVTIGGRQAIMQYLNEMIDDVYANLDKIIGMLGADQAIHIRLFYKRLHGLEKHLEHNGSGTIATLHFSSLAEFTVAHGKLHNLGKRALAVIHQYDRHPDLAGYLRRTLDSSLRSMSPQAA